MSGAGVGAAGAAGEERWMERFVFVAAVTFAIIFGVVVWLSRGGMPFSITIGDGGPPAALVAVAPGQFEAQNFAGTDLRLHHTAARVVITPEDREDFLIEINNPGYVPMPEVTLEGGLVVIDGRLGGRIDQCRPGGGVQASGYGVFPLDHLPQITIRAPRTVRLETTGAGVTEIGPTQNLTASHTGCGEVRYADVTERAELRLFGSGSLRGGAASALRIELGGSGEVESGAIGGDVAIKLMSSGEVRVASVNGALDIENMGSGEVRVDGGAISRGRIQMAGSGEVAVAAPIQELDASMLGSGDMRVVGDVGAMRARVAGSGDIQVEGEAGSLEAETLGSGDIQVTAVRGELTRRRAGSGDVIVGGSTIR